MSTPPLRLSKASGVPFYHQIKDQLSTQICAGRLAPGTLLPSIRELAATLLVSVITVKKAYEELESEGLVVSHQGRGTFVTEGLSKQSQRRARRELLDAVVASVSRAVAAGLSRDEIERAVREWLGKNRTA